MSARNSFRFGQYELRPATPDDEDLARAWTAADPAHAGRVSPLFWLEQERGVDSYVLVDAEGPIFFFRMQRAVRLFIQFSPTAERQRTRRGLEEGLYWLTAGLAGAEVVEILFDSASKMLRRFVTGKLGFTAKPETLSKVVPMVRRAPAPIASAELMDSIQQAEKGA